MYNRFFLFIFLINKIISFKFVKKVHYKTLYRSKFSSLSFLNRDDVIKTLSSIIEPDLGIDIISSKVVQDLVVNDNGDVSLKIVEASTSYAEEIKNKCILLLSSESNTLTISISKGLQSKLINQENSIPNGLGQVKNIIAVSSCKGGVGKSTVAVNLAYTLAESGLYKVGILDADIYGPSLPTMTNPKNRDIFYSNNQISPLLYEGVKLMSMGFINKGASIMRGPMVNQILNQFVSLTNWGELDYLIVDMPPGTGDIQLTLAQIMNISAAVIVTTPQRLSFVDVVKGIDLFDTVNIPCIAVVENMAEYSSYNFSSDFFEEIGIKAATILSSDPTNAIKSVSKYLKESIESQRIPLKLFGEGHAHRLREMWGIENIINIPIDGQVSKSGDSGLPYVLSNPNSQIATSMKTLAQNVKSEINRLSLKEDANSNILSYEDDLNHLVFNGAKISPFKLRTDCRCAVCVEEFTGKPLLKKELVPQSIKPLTMLPIGRYAISVDWSDGHKSLYPFKQIKNLLV